MMNKKMTVRYATTLVVGLALFAGMLAVATPARAQDDTYLELMRQDLRTNKIEIMTAAMELTSEQGEIFWPIYREYQTKLSEIGDRRIALIKEYAENYENMTGEKASSLTKNWFGQQKDRLSLLEKTAKKVAKKIDPITAAKFIQVENAVDMLIDLQVASELPLFQHGPAAGE